MHAAASSIVVADTGTLKDRGVFATRPHAEGGGHVSAENDGFERMGETPHPDW